MVLQAEQQFSIKDIKYRQSLGFKAFIPRFLRLSIVVDFIMMKSTNRFSARREGHYKVFIFLERKA